MVSTTENFTCDANTHTIIEETMRFDFVNERKFSKREATYEKERRRLQIRTKARPCACPRRTRLSWNRRTEEHKTHRIRRSLSRCRCRRCLVPPPSSFSVSGLLALDFYGFRRRRRNYICSLCESMVLWERYLRDRWECNSSTVEIFFLTFWTEMGICVWNL